MIPAVERLAVANAIAKFLAINPSEPDSLNRAVELGAPSFLTGNALWSWARTTFPSLSWMDICKKLMAPDGGGISATHPMVSLAATMFPNHAHLIGPVIDMVKDNPDQARVELEAWLSNHSTIEKGVNYLFKAPEQLIRCKDCYQPFFTDGSRGCPFCGENNA